MLTEPLPVSPSATTAPARVVGRIVELLGMRRGTRPLRSVVGVDSDLRDLDDAAVPFEAAAAMDLTDGATHGHPRGPRVSAAPGTGAAGDRGRRATSPR